MGDLAREIQPVTIENELKQSYLDYAMSVIIGRALPDVRDGLKPVHRRVLFAMNQLNNDWNKPYKKSARVVGDVIGKYHPHGDTAVYDALVRMAQPFSMRCMLIDGQGNFGSVDGDSPAAMRYTEVRMAKIAHSLLADLDKETVDFAPNYDESEMAPVVLPTRIPNLLINGSSGIAVGMATNIPPHNLGEIIDGCIALINDPDMTIDQLMELIPGPDFPTAGMINGRAGIVQAYKTGRGRIYVRARTRIETDEKSKKETIIVEELPYQVNKARLVEKIAELIKLKKIEGITALRDESDKEGMRVVIEVRRGEDANIILNNLYSHTQMQNVFGINMVALVDNQPRILNLKQILQAFIQHRCEVITRRSIYELRKARERAHLLEGLSIALVNIDPIVAMIKASKSPSEAKEKLLAQTWTIGAVKALLEKAGGDVCRPDGLPAEFGAQGDSYKLSAEQAQAILELRLHRLTGLEQDKIFEEYQALIDEIKILLELLGNPDVLMAKIKEECEEIKKEFNDPRRTEIIASQLDYDLEDLIVDEEVVVTLSHQGYVKAQPSADYAAQRRGGKGKSATNVKDEDIIANMVVANTHDTLLCFSSKGKVYWLKAYKIPQAGRQARGKPIVNLLPIEQDERVQAVVALREYSAERFVFMATSNGTVKKVSLEQFSRPRTSGIIAIDLEEGNKLVGAELTDGIHDVVLFSSGGKAIRYNEDKVRPMGRTARGVRGMALKDDQRVIALVVAHPGRDIFIASEKGYGKRTPVDEFRITGRGGQGVIAMQITDKNGAVVAATQVHDGDDVMLITDRGTVVRTPVDQISRIGRNTQGVRCINLSSGESLVSLHKVAEVENDDITEIGGAPAPTQAADSLDSTLENDPLDDNATDSPTEGNGA